MAGTLTFKTADTEDALMEFRNAIEDALYHAVQDRDRRYDLGHQITDALAKVIDAKIKDRFRAI